MGQRAAAMGELVVVEVAAEVHLQQHRARFAGRHVPGLRADAWKHRGGTQAERHCLVPVGQRQPDNDAPFSGWVDTSRNSTPVPVTTRRTTPLPSSAPSILPVGKSAGLREDGIFSTAVSNTGPSGERSTRKRIAASVPPQDQRGRGAGSTRSGSRKPPPPNPAMKSMIAVRAPIPPW